MTDKQPEALIVADALTCEASFDIHHLAIKAMKEGASLLRTQHAAIERKDALLRQALDALLPEACGHTEETRQTRAVAAIKQELSQ